MPRASQMVLVVKNLPANAGDVRDTGSTHGSGRSSGGEHGNPLQYSCLENPPEQRSLVGYSPRSHKESDMTEVTEHTPAHRIAQRTRYSVMIHMGKESKRVDIYI